jgi:hypothetical protein
MSEIEELTQENKQIGGYHMPSHHCAVTAVTTGPGERKLRSLVRLFRDALDAGRSHRQWKQIEKEVFGLEFDD